MKKLIFILAALLTVSAAMQAQHGMSDMEIDMAYEQMLEDEGLSASSAHLIDIDQ